MEATPASFVPLLTSSLTLKCAIGDFPQTASDGAIGETDLTDNIHSQEVSRQSFRTASEIKYIGSMVISREGHEIGSISSAPVFRMMPKFP